MQAEQTIRIINLDGTENQYSLDDIEDITFDLDDSVFVLVTDDMDNQSRIELGAESEIAFILGEIEFRNVGANGNTNRAFELNNIKSIQFELNEIIDYPFGELAVDEIIVNGLSNPWSLDFLDTNTIIFNEKSGGLFIHDLNNNSTTEVNGMPPIADVGQGGFLDITVHPEYATNNEIYFAYVVGGNGGFTTAIGKAKFEYSPEMAQPTLNDFQEIFRGDPMLSGGQHFGSRIIFDNEGKLYFAIGDRGRMENGQDSTNHYASVLRINTDGSVPQDNPYLDAPGAKPELYTMGNRNIQGMFYLKEKDEIWAIEHGPRGGDELNVIEAGENYAWPLATYGINYNGTPITDQTSIPGYKDPVTYWVPSIAPCGMDMISYDSEKDELDIIIATLAGTHLHRILVKDYEVVETVRSLEGYARFRDVQRSPDGYLYAATQSPGRIIRLEMK
jgi:glucose/arabinose dehydrogenase